MAKMIFRLNGVSDEEAYDVREALHNAELDVYETHQGRWGFSVAAIWLRDNSQFEEARAIIDRVQEDRYERLKNEPVASFLEKIRQEPATVVLSLAAALAMIGLTLIPFLTVFD